MRRGCEAVRVASGKRGGWGHGNGREAGSNIEEGKVERRILSAKITMAIICDTGIGIGIETAFHITHAPREPRAANHYMHNILEGVLLYTCVPVCVGECIWVSLTYAALAAAFIMCKYIYGIYLMSDCNVTLKTQCRNGLIIIKMYVILSLLWTALRSGY